MQLHQLLSNVSGITFNKENNTLNQEITGISTNSHTCNQGDLFIGMPGTKVNGGDFCQSAIESGAVACIVNSQSADKIAPNFGDRLIICDDIINACAKIATNFYDNPSQKLKLIGVTGTNGKTTTSHLIEFFFNSAEKPTALIGTLYSRWAGYHKIATHTTPFAVELQAELANICNHNNQYTVMEVSSHALDQGRVKGCNFSAAVFTNLTQDHLDYHQNMDNYFKAKSLLFTPEYLKGKAIINYDDFYGQKLIKSLNPDQVFSYSVSDSNADFYTSNLTYQVTGVTGILHTPKGEIKFNSPLIGEFNISNLLAAIAVSFYSDLDLEIIVKNLPNFNGVPGRVERVTATENQDITVIVDYAHTPDGLENLLKSSRPFISNKMICVFGCGGDRDRTKRPIMGKIASELSDIIVVTSDNPRTENPQKILDDILIGIKENIEVIVISDRALAIKTAIEKATSGDGVLIAGKGHEDYQILGTEKIHFDDREEAKKGLINKFK